MNNFRYFLLFWFFFVGKYYNYLGSWKRYVKMLVNIVINLVFKRVFIRYYVNSNLLELYMKNIRLFEDLGWFLVWKVVYLRRKNYF